MNSINSWANGYHVNKKDLMEAYKSCTYHPITPTRYPYWMEYEATFGTEKEHNNMKKKTEQIKKDTSNADPIAAQLDFAIEAGLNVLLEGKHGVGKTSLVQSVFDKHGLNYLYFSASTMDPFTDFIGVPKEMENESGEKYLGFVRPEAFMDDSIEAIFFDEYNRSPKKVRNAVMELIQFKSINGRSFPNLKYVWAAVNPDDDDDETYDVEIMDPAQRDRFQLQIAVPYECSASYFIKKYPGGSGTSAINWWNDLKQAQKNKVSPRRLDYVMDALINKSAPKMVISSMLPDGINVKSFMDAVQTGSLKEKVIECIGSNNTKELEFFVNGPDSGTIITCLVEIVSGIDSRMDAIVDVADDETLVRIIESFSEPVRNLKGSDRHKERFEELKKLKSLSGDIRAKIDSLLVSDEEDTTCCPEYNMSDIEKIFFGSIEK